MQTPYWGSDDMNAPSQNGFDVAYGFGTDAGYPSQYDQMDWGQQPDYDYTQDPTAWAYEQKESQAEEQVGGYDDSSNWDRWDRGRQGGGYEQSNNWNPPASNAQRSKPIQLDVELRKRVQKLGLATKPTKVDDLTLQRKMKESLAKAQLRNAIQKVAPPPQPKKIQDSRSGSAASTATPEESIVEEPERMPQENLDWGWNGGWNADPNAGAATADPWNTNDSTVNQGTYTLDQSFLAQLDDPLVPMTPMRTGPGDVNSPSNSNMMATSPLSPLSAFQPPPVSMLPSSPLSGSQGAPMSPMTNLSLFPLCPPPDGPPPFPQIPEFKTTQQRNFGARKNKNEDSQLLNLQPFPDALGYGLDIQKPPIGFDEPNTSFSNDYIDLFESPVYSGRQYASAPLPPSGGPTGEKSIWSPPPKKTGGSTTKDSSWARLVTGSPSGGRSRGATGPR